MNALQKMLVELDYSVRSYSGRAMYGRSCLGVVLDSENDVSKLMSKLILNVEEEERSEVAKAVRGFKTDSMGMGIVLYFPEVEYEDDDDDEDEYPHDEDFKLDI